MFKKFMVLVTLLMVFIFQAQSLVAETGGKEPKVDDFNRQRPAPPPAEQPDLLQEPDEQPQEANEIKIQVTRFNFTGNTVLSNEQLTNLTKDFVGKELSYNELRDVLRFISNFYRELGLWARAILPEQDINNGVITIQIVEGRLGKVIIKSDEQDLNLKQDVARKYIENKISRQQILNINQLEKNISRSSGRSRGTALINFDSLLKQGEQFTIQRVQTIGSEYNALAGSFRIGYGGTRGTVKAAKLRYDLGDPFSSSNPTGNSEELSVSIDHPLNSIGRTNLSSNFTFSESDYENKNNSPSNVQKKITRGIAKLNFNRSDQFYKGGVNYGSASVTVGDLDDTSTGSQHQMPWVVLVN
jgi:hemolysin activation/secretion protein